MAESFCCVPWVAHEENNMKAKELLSKFRVRLNMPAMYLLFGAWYFVEGLIGAFLVETLLARLYDKGLSKADGGAFLAIIGIPWIAKPLWGPLIDRYGKSYNWAMVTTLLTAVLVACLPLVDGAGYAMVVVAVFLPNLARSFQDVAVDGLSIQLVEEKFRGEVQTAMKIGFYLGALLGGAFAIKLMKGGVEWWKLCVVMGMITALVGVCLPVIIRSYVGFRENEKKKEQMKWSDVLAIVRNRNVWLALVIAALMYVAQGLTAPIFNPWITEIGYGDRFASFLAWGTVSQVGGAVIGGLLWKFFPGKRAFVLAVLVEFAAYCLIGLLPNPLSQSVVRALFCFNGFADGLYGVVLFTMFMDLVDLKFAATSFATYMAMTNLSESWANWVGGILGEHLPVAQVFLIAGLAQLVILLPLRWLKLERKQ